MPKRRNFLSFLFCFLFFFLPYFSVFSEERNNFSFPEKIESFLAEIEIRSEGYFLVKENIVYDFGNKLRHGIYRDIPARNIGIKVEKVTDELGHEYPVKISKYGDYLRIRVGDPNKLISGKKTYNISYLVKNGLSFFSDHDEIYWNVTGNEWNVPIKQSGAIIYLPTSVPLENLRADCFTGYAGSKEKECVFEIREGKIINFLAKKSFYPNEGLTIVVGWPKGIVKELGFIPKSLQKIEKILPYFIPVFVFFYLLKEWWFKGKDPKINKPIVPLYEPPDNLRPVEVGIILNQELKPRDLTATLIDLGVKGFLKIREVEKNDYEIERLMDNLEGLKPYEKKFFSFLSIFQKGDKVRISSLKKQHNLYKKYEKLVEEIYKDVVSRKYFTNDPSAVRITWMAIGASLVSLSIFTFLFSIYFFLPRGLALSFFLSGIIVVIFSPFMPRRTKKGVETYWKILGFREYMKTAEKYRAQFYEKENIFEKYLPYAIVFDLVDKWAKAFEGLYKNVPNWYEGNYGGGVFVSDFSHSLNSFTSSITHSFSSSSRSGFGGSAGEGGGGGGGGSW